MIVQDEDTLTADGTEQTLGGAFTSAGVYVLTVNLGAMVAGDTVSLRGYVKVLTGDSEKRLAYSAEFANAQGDSGDVGDEAGGDVCVLSVPLPSPYAVEFTLIQEAGSFRNFPWRVITL